MRPTSKQPGAVWRLLEQWSANHPLRPNQSQMAGWFDVSTSLFSDWKYGRSVMQAADIDAIAEKTGIEIGLLAKAVAEDRRVMGNAEHPAPTNAIAARRSRRRPPRGSTVQPPD